MPTTAKKKKVQQQKRNLKRESGGGQPALRWALTDLGNAERFVARHGEKVRYCEELGKWLVFNSQVWTHDSGGVIHRLAYETVKRIKDEAAQEGLSTDEKAEIEKHSRKSASKGRLNAMQELAKWLPGIAVPVKELDASPWLLGCTNGTLDLKTGELHGHDHRNLITRMVKAPFHRDAECPTWDGFLDKISGGDAEKVGFLQRVIGYCLTGVTTEQCMFIFYGPGANGKTTLLETLRELLGDFAFHTTTASLLHASNSMIRNDLARLNNARLVTAVEVGSGKRLDEALVKQLTGGDRVTARYLYREFFEFNPQFKLVIAANHKPEIRGVDHGIWRRIHLVPFSVTIPANEIDKGLPQKLRNELPGILAWAVRGCCEWREKGLMVPDSVLQATADYREEMDTLENFLSDRCKKDGAKRCALTDLYVAYSEWSGRVCQDPIGKKAFGNLMKQKGYQQAKSGPGRYWKGLELVQESVQPAT